MNTAHMPAPSKLSADSRLEPVGDNAFDAEVSLDWCVADVACGGYALSLGLRALGEVLTLPDPLTSTAHYLAPLRQGPVRIETEIIRSGRTVARGAARLLQGDTVCVSVIAAFVTLTENPDRPLYYVEPAFKPAPFEECIEIATDTPDGRVAHVRTQLDIRWDPGSVGWAKGEPTGRPEIAVWTRAADGSDADPFLIPVIVDAMPATGFDLGIVGKIPTLELTVHQRAIAAPGWLRATYRSRLVADGYVEEDCNIWDSTERLVAMARQISMLPR